MRHKLCLTKCMAQQNSEKVLGCQAILQTGENSPSIPITFNAVMNLLPTASEHSLPRPTVYTHSRSFSAKYFFLLWYCLVIQDLACSCCLQVTLLHNFLPGELALKARKININRLAVFILSDKVTTSLARRSLHNTNYLFAEPRHVRLAERLPSGTEICFIFGF